MRRSRALAGSALFLVAAPGSVTGLAPWLVSGWDRRPSSLDGHRTAGTLVTATGAALVVAGGAVLLGAFVRFAVRGLGTPAPVAPTEHLVVDGAYRFVRNPMYLAVVGVLVGETLLTRSLPLLVWTCCATAAMVAFVVGYEEPALRRRFGAGYAAYAARVPRWLPRRPR